MAEKSKQSPPKNAMQRKSGVIASDIPEVLPKKRRLFKKILVVFVLLSLLGLGFAAGIYLKLIDVQQSAENMNLKDAPLIGKYFQKPKTNFDPVDLNPSDSVAPSPGNSLTASPQTAALAPNQAVLPGGQPGTVVSGDPNAANAQDLVKQAKLKQAQEAKKISKLARLYGEMKPEEAVPILTKLDNATIVAILNKMEEDQAAQILAQFDPAKAAQISQAMLAVAVIQ